ncbi:MAG: flagellar basal body rod C-terminal domain-containing protein, partial [Pseudomonadota bacterium]
FTATSKVDVDEEMARLIELQAAFQANARIISAYQELVMGDDPSSTRSHRNGGQIASSTSTNS